MRIRDMMNGASPPVRSPIAFYADFVPFVGINATLFLSQIAYWSGRGTGKFGPYWIYKSSDRIQAETGLTYKEQRAARNRLKRFGILVEHHDYIEHRIYFFIDQYRLIARWKEWTE